MALPWLAVGKLVLNNLDTIIGVVKPGFTRKKVDADHMDLLNQQIAELQAAASSNAEQTRNWPRRSRKWWPRWRRPRRCGGGARRREAVVVRRGDGVRVAVLVSAGALLARVRHWRA